MTDSVLNAAWIGCGAIARKKHLPAAVQNPNLHIKALFNRTPQTAVLCKEEFGCRDADVVTDAEEIFDRGDIDLVFICTPNDTHGEYAIRALEHGKHVICEKPMAADYLTAQRMLEASVRNQKLLHISYQNRYTDQALYAKQLMEEGILGEIYYGKAYALRRRAVPTWGQAGKRSQGGGPLLDIGSHAIDLTLWLSGCFQPERAVGNTYDKLARQGSRANHWGSWDASQYETEDLAVGFVVMQNGMTISVEASYALNIAEEKEASVDLFGTKGGLELRQQEGVTIVQELGGRMVIARNDIQKTVRGLTPGTVKLTPAQREQNAVVAMLLNGVTVDPAAAQALQVEKIIDGLYRSAAMEKEICF